MSGRRPLVLCIENESGSSRQKAPLERHGYDVLVATSGGDALNALRQNPVDAIILDFETPGISSDAGIRRMKETKPHIPVLLLVSAFAKSTSGRQPAADAVLLKSEAPMRLPGVLATLLNVQFPFFTRWLGNWKHRAGA